jgi:hypothetical protein
LTVPELPAALRSLTPFAAARYHVLGELQTLEPSRHNLIGSIRFPVRVRGIFCFINSVLGRNCLPTAYHANFRHPQTGGLTVLLSRGCVLENSVRSAGIEIDCPTSTAM